MNKINQFDFILTIFILLILASKWLVVIFLYQQQLDFETSLLLNIKDSHYFPIIISLSNLDFSPSFLGEIESNKLISFPIGSLIINSFLYKYLGLNSFLFSEFFFKILFYLIFLRFLKKIFSDNFKSFYFIVFLILITYITYFISENFSHYTLKNLYSLFDENLGSRIPRPLITHIFLFYFFYIIIDFKQNIISPKYSYIAKVSITLSFLLNSFFYYFVISSILIFFLFLITIKSKIIFYLKNNYLKIIFFILTFGIFTIPFFIQNLYAEDDYARRIGVIYLELDDKIEVLNYYLRSLLRLEILVFIILSIILHILYISKKKFFKRIKSIEILFYFLISSLISPILFILFSPKVISIYHFIGIIIFFIIFYNLIIFYNFIFNFLHSKNIMFFNKKIGLTIAIIFLFITSLIIENNKINKEINYFSDLYKINDYINDNISSAKLFTNDRYIMNLWLFKSYGEIIISDGFTNSLTDNEIENNLINSIKFFTNDKNLFEKILFDKENNIRNPLMSYLFNYKYQANSLYTYSNINNYDNIDKISKISPFRVQNQIMPIDEKIRFLEKYNEHKINKNFIPEIIIINLKEFNFNPDVNKKKYDRLYSNRTFELYKFKKF